MPDVSQSEREFEQFVCAASHNLRQSLRNLRLLAEEAPDSGFEAQICAIESTLKGMVEYSVACVSESRVSPVDVEGVLKQALAHFDNGAITYDPLPTVMADPRHLETVLRHLLDNAIKFHGLGVQKIHPKIRVSAKLDGSTWILSIHDNGPGIDAAYQEKVFIPFKRLHGQDYPGNGLGLSICRKLIERNGGRIWVETNPESGSTVSFTLTSPQ